MGDGGDWGREEGVVLLLHALSTKANNKFYSLEELIIEPHHKTLIAGSGELVSC